MRLRDNQSDNPDWHSITNEDLTARGIVISPQELSEFLGGHVPSGFQSKGVNRWVIRRQNSNIRVQWDAKKRRMSFSDIRHGRNANIFIVSPK